MDIFTEIKVALFKRHSVTLWCKPQGTAHTLLFLLHTVPRYPQHQYHTSFVAWIKVSGRFCPVIKAFDYHKKSIKILFIHPHFPAFSKCHSRVWQGDISIYSTMHCFAFWGLGAWGYLGGCCLVVWSFYTQCFGGLLTNFYGSQMFVFGPNLIVLCFVLFYDPTLWR